MISFIKPTCRSLMVLKSIKPESKIDRVFKDVVVRRPIICEGVSYGYYKEKIRIYNDPKP